jgi:hypothetical protein
MVMTSAPKKLFIKTYGCQMNVYDSERMAEAMGGAGYIETTVPDDADMSCSTPATSARRPPKSSIPIWAV